MGSRPLASRCKRARQPLTAHRAHAACNGAHLRHTLIAYRQTRNLNQRCAAKTAIGGEQRGKNAFGDAAHRGDQRRRHLPRDNFGTGCPELVSTTAEDKPPSSSRRMGLQAAESTSV